MGNRVPLPAALQGRRAQEEEDGGAPPVAAREGEPQQPGPTGSSPTPATSSNLRRSSRKKSPPSPADAAKLRSASNIRRKSMRKHSEKVASQKEETTTYAAAAPSHRQTSRKTKSKSHNNSSRHDDQWEEMFQKVKDFKELYGHCVVPTVYGVDPALGYWVRRQRQAKSQNKLDADRMAKLDSIGFIWVARTGPGANKSLSAGAAPPTAKRKSSKNAEEKPAKKKYRKLTKSEQKWEKNIQKLRDYKAEHGDCLVPQKYDSDPSLGFFVANQRSAWRNHTLLPERKKQLDSIGFRWGTASRP